MKACEVDTHDETMKVMEMPGKIVVSLFMHRGDTQISLDGEEGFLAGELPR